MLKKILFKNTPQFWDENRQYFKSAVDLKLLPEQVIYVEETYNRKINRYFRKNHCRFSSRLKQLNPSADFIYTPMVMSKLQESKLPFSTLLRYFFPTVTLEEKKRKKPIHLETHTISQLLFSLLKLPETTIGPGLFRCVSRDGQGVFTYEYFRFDLSQKQLLQSQINFYIDTCIFLEEPFFNIEKFTESESISTSGNYDILPPNDYNAKSHIDRNDSLLSIEDEKGEILPHKKRQVCYESAPPQPNLFSTEKRKVKADVSEKISEEQELIHRIRRDIQNVKDLGFYELLIKEIGHLLLQKEENELFPPSRLLISDDFRIYLPDFHHIEITMSTLPKSLFILFLRHPKGINLKHLVDYKKELLEIYKLLSYRETYLQMVESINRICNPLEGSINEKLSRIKEAFLKKISIDSAQYYIVSGERGMPKRILLDPSLVQFPRSLEEIGKTGGGS